MSANLYPKSPKLDNYDFVKPSSNFRSSVLAIILSILLFFLFYVVLIALAASIMLLTGWAGISIISAKPSFITIALGAGIIALGVMLFIFLFKFVFSKTKNENPLRIEIHEGQHPQLFDFIRNLMKDTKTKFPKRIFISSEVNAMVFYNSSFWSLFFPVRKNLEIGLGLVNSLNVSEFKSVLAHEFGHFSQKSMKVGSYIYTVNRVIYNLVYEYDNWDNVLFKWAQAGGVFGFFATVTFWLVERVRSLLKVAYNLININYMKLSREMEYHADLVAVSVSGNYSFKNALRKIEFTSISYEYMIDCLNSFAAKQKAADDIYVNHSFTTFFLAKHRKISVEGGELNITDKDIENSVVKSRINLKNQWASHPTLKEREKNIGQVEIQADINKDSAWTLFNGDGEEIRNLLSRKLYDVGFQGVVFETLKESKYREYVETEVNKYKISEAYNGFYEGRYISKFDPTSLIESKSSFDFNQLYSKNNVEKIKRLESNKADLKVLEQISLKQLQVKYFEFDGLKYRRKEANKLITSLKKEIKEEAEFVLEIDKQAFVYNYNNAVKQDKSVNLINQYQVHYEKMDTLISVESIATKFQSFADSLYSKTRWTDDEIKQLTAELSSLEKQFKDLLLGYDKIRLFDGIEDVQQRKIMNDYYESTDYFSKTSYFDEEAFLQLTNLLQIVYESTGKQYGDSLKNLTDFQLELRMQHV